MSAKKQYTLTGKPVEIRAFSLAFEIEKLKNLMMIPITNIVFDDRYEYGKLYMNEDTTLTVIYGQIYVNDDLIGNIPYMSDKWGPMYDTSKRNELAWDKVYRQYEQVIFDKILAQSPLTATADIEAYGTLILRDKDGTHLNTAYCNYIDGEWNIVLAGLNPKEDRVEIQVIVSPPPPIGI